MREMFEERIRELEEVKQATTTSLSAGSFDGNNNNSSSGGVTSSSAFNNISINAKTDAEILEDQAVTVLEGWRKRRRGESNLGKIQIADALRDLDTARRMRKQKYQDQLKKE